MLEQLKKQIKHLITKILVTYISLIGRVIIYPRSHSDEISDCINKFCWWAPSNVTCMIITDCDNFKFEAPKYQRRLPIEGRYKLDHKKRWWMIFLPALYGEQCRYKKRGKFFHPISWCVDTEGSLNDDSLGWEALSRLFANAELKKLKKQSEENIQLLKDQFKALKSINLFGAGPSIDTIHPHAIIPDSVNFGCNSVFQSKLFENGMVYFDLYALQDRLLFFSSSLYTERFFDEFLNFHLKKPFFIIAPLQRVPILCRHYPVLSSYFICYEITGDESSKHKKNLTLTYKGSVLTTLMIPFAFEFEFKRINLYGIDGPAPSGRPKKSFVHHESALDKFRYTAELTHPSKKRNRPFYRFLTIFEKNLENAISQGIEKNIVIKSVAKSNFKCLQ